MILFRTRAFSLLILILILLAFVSPNYILGSSTPQKTMEDHLAHISEQEKIVLETLFSLSLQLEDLRIEQAQITTDIDLLKPQISELQQLTADKQQAIDSQLDVLKKVLINYQRRGATSYLDVLLGAGSLSDFLTSINVLKDLSRNSAELLAKITLSQAELLAEQTKLEQKDILLQQRLVELSVSLSLSEQIKREQSDYLQSLQDEINYYEDRLITLEAEWESCKKLFSEFLADLMGIIESEHFVLENEYLSFDFFRMQVKLQEGSFNSILSKHSKFPDTVFRFQNDEAVIEFPSRNLVLKGSFILVGNSAIKFEAISGTFHQLPLNQASLNQLFLQGPLLIDFATFTENFILEFSISRLEIKGNELVFSIKF